MSIASSISAIGNVCTQLQRPYGAVQRAIEQLSIKPAIVINTVPHYSDDDIERIAKHLECEAGHHG
jgi:hypothetical protein